MTSSLQFRSLPLVEVAVRMAFENDLDPGLSLNQVLQIYAQLSSKFEVPQVDQTFERAPGHEVAPSFRQIPSCLFRSKSRPGVLIRLQDNMLGVYWHAVAPEADQAGYPRFSALLSAFDEFLQAGELAEVSWPAFDVANITYGNFLRGERSTTDLLAYFDRRSIPELLADALLVQNYEAGWKTGSGIDRRLVLNLASVIGPTGPLAGHLIRTVAGDRIREAEPWRGLIDRLHDDLQQFFGSVISERAKTEWGYISEN